MNQQLLAEGRIQCLEDQLATLQRELAEARQEVERERKLKESALSAGNRMLTEADHRIDELRQQLAAREAELARVMSAGIATLDYVLGYCKGSELVLPHSLRQHLRPTEDTHHE